MSRLKVLAEEELTPPQRDLRLALARGLRGQTAVGGPFDVWLHSPEFGSVVQRFGEHVRFRTSLPARVSELAIILCARFWRAQYEWYAHAPIAQRAGLPPTVIEAIRVGIYPELETEIDRTVYSMCQELLCHGRVSDTNYENAYRLLGKSALIELVGLLGYYTLVAFTVNAFSVEAPAGEVTPLEW
jgi:4-carboxymuconolactone decarboxylase